MHAGYTVAVTGEKSPLEQLEGAYVNILGHCLTMA